MRWFPAFVLLILTLIAASFAKGQTLRAEPSSSISAPF